MLGLACGDALGAPAEFMTQADLKAKWGTLKDMVGGGCWAPGEWTDDTGMALCIAEGILASPDDPVEETGRRFLEWRETAKDVGNTISAALSAYEGDWAAAARSTPQASVGRAAGNGSLMRTLPVALAYGVKDEELPRVAAQLSSMTHWDQEAMTCCLVYCYWVGELLEGLTPEQAWRKALKTAAKVAAKANWPGVPQEGGVSPEFWSRLEAVETLTYERLQPSGYAGRALECLEAAAWCCLNADSLEDALVKAVNLAGEADTIAAVAGGAAGACWGPEAIPRRWTDKLHQRAEVEQIATRLARLRRHREVYSTPQLPAFSYNQVGDRILCGRNPLTCHDIEILKSHGITHVLDLREPHECGDGRFGREAIEEIEACGLQRVSLPVTDLGAPTDETLAAACQFLDEALKDENARIYVHCRAGLERTAAILVAFHASRHGTSYEEALEKLREGRPALRPLPGQKQAVMNWLSRQGAVQGASS